MQYNDEIHLLDHLKLGKQEAFDNLVDTYSNRLFGYALTLAKDEDMAQDIIQNVFLKSWLHRKKIKIKGTLQNYLFRSVRNEFLNLYKKQRSTMVLEQKYFESLERVTSGYDEKTLKQAFNRVICEIQNLPPKCREVFLLSRKEGLTNIEISEYLNISDKTVEGHITKAFSILRKKLDAKLNVVMFLSFKSTAFQGHIFKS